MKRITGVVVVSCLAMCLHVVVAEAVTFTFDAADLFNIAGDPTDGLLQKDQENPHRLWYRDLNGDIVNWGVTYGSTLVSRFASPDPAASYANLQNWIAGDDPYQPRITAFNVSLRPYDGSTDGWGQDIVFRNPPADWTTGDAAEAASFLSATAPAGWQADLLWHPWAGPMVQWVTTDPLDDPFGAFIDPNSGGLLFQITGDFLRDTDLDGIGDTEIVLGEDARLYLGTETIWADWEAAGLDLSQTTTGPQFDAIVGVKSVPEPVTAVLVALAFVVLAPFRRFARN